MSRAEEQAEGIQLGEEGGQAALHGYALTVAEEGRQWRILADLTLDALIRDGAPFTSEDVVHVIGPAPSRNAIGGLFAGRKKEIKVVGTTLATRKEAHGRILRVWQSKKEKQ